MGKMKEIFIAMMNEDWEHLPAHEQAIIRAEKAHMEQQLMQEILFEEQQAAKIQVIKDEKEKEDGKHSVDHNSLPF